MISQAQSLTIISHLLSLLYILQVGTRIDLIHLVAMKWHRCPVKAFGAYSLKQNTPPLAVKNVVYWQAHPVHYNSNDLKFTFTDNNNDYQVPSSKQPWKITLRFGTPTSMHCVDKLCPVRRTRTVQDWCLQPWGTMYSFITKLHLV